jgi:Uma2 family endonuclease
MPEPSKLSLEEPAPSDLDEAGMLDTMATTSGFPVQDASSGEERRVLLHGISWSTYELIRDAIESSAVRMTYFEGALEIMTTSREHEVNKKQIARLLELFCLERDIPLYGYGGMTFKKKELGSGFEPDECYCRGTDRLTPDIALEVVISHPLLDKLKVYRKFEVREVWVFEEAAFKVFALRDGRYELCPASEVFPEVDLVAIARMALMPDQHAALRAFRDELRG